MALRAVVFDYGMVLSNPPDMAARREMEVLTGLAAEDFEQRYWVDRLAYDRGDLTALTYWEKFGADAGLSLSKEDLVALSAHDARMWTTTNAVMLEWQQKLKAAGIRTGILSNMGDNVLERIVEIFAWVEDFDALVWSYQHGMVKPDPEIYQLAAEKIGAPTEEILFLDDRLENIEGAERVGMHGLQFSTVEQLRKDLVAKGYDAWLPLP
ncbi:MAG TPA: HAD family phosphatase [Acidobacteriaceae bacterium]|nr:HAD family phosphatase [Acidobacteriaceae bacterium]